ncbi:MAG: protein kinase [Victivallis vadensis]
MKIYCAKCNHVFSAEVPADGDSVPCPKCGAPVKFPENKLGPGTVIGDFVIERALSKGGMGEVFLAKQISLDRPVALKVLQDKFLDDKEYVDSLFREARAAGKISHPNIVQAYAVGEEDGIFYFAMEFIRGETLKQILKREKKLEFTMAARIIREIAGALDAAWREQKLVHQDIKPDNIMLDGNGFAKLADLGLARVASTDQDEEVGDEVMGTPQYISPEQLTGISTDVRSDIYSLGATFYQFVTGRFPYVADTAEEIAKMHVAGNLTPPKEVNPEVPDELNDIIMKMMARDREDRYQTPQPLMKALDIFLRNYQSGKSKMPSLNLNFGQKTASRPVSTQTVPNNGKVTDGVSAPQMAAPKPFDFGQMKPLGFGNEKPAAPAASPAPAAPAAPSLAGAPTLSFGLKEDKPAAPAVPAAPQMTENSATLSLGLNKPEEKPAEPKAEEAPQDDVQKPPFMQKDAAELAKIAKQAEKIRKREARRQRWEEKKIGKKLKIAGIAVGVLLILAIALSITLYWMAGAGKLPESLKPTGEKFRAFIDGKVDAAKEEMAENARKKEQEEAAEKERLAAAEAAKPRQAYLDGVEAAFSALRSNPDQPENFVKLAEELFDRYPAPRNDAERKAYDTLLPMYGRFDEVCRVQPARDAARAKHEAQIEARRQADAEARNASAEAEAEARRQREEAERAAREQEARLRQQAEENRRMVQERTARLKANLAGYYPAMVAGFNRQVFDNDPEALKRAIQVSREALIPSVSDSAEEKRLIAQMESFRRELPKEAEKLRRIIADFGKITTKNFFSIQPGNNILDIVKVAPGVVQYRLSNGTIHNLDLKDARIRQMLFSRLDRWLKINDSEFYFRMMGREYSPELQKIAPKGFWQQCIVPFIEAARK